MTVDALNWKCEITEQVVVRGGGYATVLKGNRGTRHDDVQPFPDGPQANSYVGNLQKAHRRKSSTRLPQVTASWPRAWPKLEVQFP